MKYQLKSWLTTLKRFYEPLDSNEGKEMENLHTDPISAGEMNSAYLKMKKVATTIRSMS